MGHRIDRLRVIPKRIVSADPGEKGFWHNWAEYVVKRPGRIAAAGIAIVVLLLIPAVKLNPSEAEAKNLPGTGDAFQGRDALSAAGLSEGALKPYVVLIEHGSSDPVRRSWSSACARRTADGASAPPAVGAGRPGLVEAIPSTDGAAKPARKVISNLQHNVLPDLQQRIGGPVRLTLGGVAPEDRDFVHAVYGNFPYVLGFVVLLTFLLLMRAFRSIVLAVKAVLLNLISLACALGVVVFIFQQGHGSEAIWGIKATQAVIAWIPLMIFAFLFGLSMDYEVFIVTRIREAYDATKDTKQAIALGLARTGKLVTSAALVLVFAFFSLSTGPGPDIKQFGIGLAAGVLIDATLIRAVLLPSLMMLLGKYNWWFPEPVRKARRACAPSPHSKRTISSTTLPKVAVTSASWSPSSWRGLPALQQPDWPDPAHVRQVVEQITRMPPLVFAGEARSLLARPRRRSSRGARSSSRPGLRRVVPRLERTEPAGEAEDHAPDVGDAHLRGERAGREGGADRRPVREAALRSRRRRWATSSSRPSAATSSTARSPRPRHGRRTPSACSRPTIRRPPRSTCCARSRRAASPTSARSMSGRRSSSPTRPKASATSRSPTRSSGRWPS